MPYILKPGDAYFLTVAIVFSTMLVFLLLRSLRKLRLGKASLNWRAVEATIDNIQILDDIINHDERRTFSPYVQYTYSVGGTTYQGRNYSFRWRGRLRYWQVAQEIEGLTRGKTITVYFDPFHPEDSVVKRGVTTANHIAPLVEGLLLVILLIGIAMDLSI